jgi:hypothetical protein
LQSRFEFNATLVTGSQDVLGDQIIETGVLLRRSSNSFADQATTSRLSFQKLAATRS